MSSPLEKLANRVRGMVARGVVNMVADGLKMQGMQVQLLDGETVDNVERAQNYGFTSVPQGGAECFVVFVGGGREHGIILAADDRRFRLKSLQGGEVAMYTDEGDTLIFKRDHKVELTTRHFVVKAEDDVTVETTNFTVTASEGTQFNTPNLSFGGQNGGSTTATMTGGLNATGDIKSNGGAVSLNSHIHEGVEPGSGTSDKPQGGV